MSVLDIVLTIGIPSIVIALIYIGRKLQVLDTLEKRVGDIYDRFIKTEDRVESLWKDKFAPSRSPRKLNDYGQKILDGSGIREVVDNKRLKLLELVKVRAKIKNAYDAEQVIFNIMEDLPKHCPDVIDKLKTGAFNTGSSLGTVLFVGGFYLRDLIFPELGFTIDQIDKRNEQEQLEGFS